MEKVYRFISMALAVVLSRTVIIVKLIWFLRRETVFHFRFVQNITLIFLQHFYLFFFSIEFQVLPSILPKVYFNEKRNSIDVSFHKTDWSFNKYFYHTTEWFTASDSNICYVTYAYEKIPDGPFDTLLTAREMVKTHRLQYAAKVVRDLVLGVREQCIQNETPGCLKNMSQVTQLGFR